MYISDRQIITAVRLGLRQLGTQLAGGDGAHMVGLLETAMAELAARDDGRDAALRTELHTTLALTQRATQLAAGLDETHHAAAPTHITPDSPAHMHAVRAQAVRALADRLLTLDRARAAGHGDAAWRESVRELLLAVARLDTDSAVELTRAPPLGTAAVDAEPLGQRLARYLAQCAGCAALPGPFELLESKLLSGGFSRQTIRARLRDRNGVEHTVIVRKQVPGGFLVGACNTLAEEIPFHRLTHANGLPVPQLYWHESDERHLGADFLVMACAPGATLAYSYGMASGIGEPFFRELAQTLAKLHCIDWSPYEAELRASSRIPDGTRIDCHAAGLAMVDQFDNHWRRAGVAIPATLELTGDWLRRNVPRVDRRVVLCHADIGFHNLLIDDGHVSALLDWETSRLVDPAREIAYVHTMVSHYMDWDTFLGWYVEAGGQPIDQASLDYYALFSKFAAVIVTEVAMGDCLPRAALPNLEDMRLGWPARAYFFQEMLRDGWLIWGR